jgi:hypothetical protein
VIDMHAAHHHQTSETSQAIPPLPILVPSGEPERRDLSGTLRGHHCYCGRAILVPCEGVVELDRGQWMSQRTSRCCGHTLYRYVPRLNVTALGIIGRFPLIELEPLS